jgi:HD-GYP domain-containing protein (c-di-GMP phosphodiesterase class II)
MKRQNPKPRGANTVNDTRALLNRIADFRKRLDEMPRLIPAPQATQTVEEPKAAHEEPAARNPVSRTQAILEYSLRQLSGSAEAEPPALSDRARRLLGDAQGLVTRLKSLVDEPLLAGPPVGQATEAADPLSVHFRETAALTEAAVRYAMTFPESETEQRRLCEGLEGIIDAARRRFELLAGTLERRRTEEARIDVLARFLVCMTVGEGRLDPGPVVDLAESLLEDEPGRPLRFVAARPKTAQAYLGGFDYPAPARFVAAHSLNVACVLTRIVVCDSDWKEQVREIVLAALLHDVGMLQQDPEVLSYSEAIDQRQRREIETHAHKGARLLIDRVPELSGLAEALAAHHERANGTGYPTRLRSDQVTPWVQLLAVADVYSAMCTPRPHRPARDPRSALTDVMLMADRGEFDRNIAKALLSVGLYPSGTVVELAGGATAVVLSPRDPRTEYNKAARPAIALLTDEDGKPLANPRFLDLADVSSRNVIRTLGPMDRLERLGRSYPEWV